MAQGKITSLAQMTSHLTKNEIAVRQEVEALEAAKPRTKPKPTSTLTPEEKKFFNRLIRLNDSFTEADSISLTLLVKSVHRYNALDEALQTLDILDDIAGSVERRMLAYDRAIQQHMTALSIPLTQRLRMNNDMMKIMIEERKLEQVNNQAQPIQEVNPMLQLLEALKQ